MCLSVSGLAGVGFDIRCYIIIIHTLLYIIILLYLILYSSLLLFYSSHPIFLPSPPLSQSNPSQSFQFNPPLPSLLIFSYLFLPNPPSPSISSSSQYSFLSSPLLLILSPSSFPTILYLSVLTYTYLYSIIPFPNI